jgi:hypothetical protein
MSDHSKCEEKHERKDRIGSEWLECYFRMEEKPLEERPGRQCGSKPSGYRVCVCVCVLGEQCSRHKCPEVGRCLLSRNSKVSLWLEGKEGKERRANICT